MIILGSRLTCQKSLEYHPPTTPTLSPPEGFRLNKSPSVNRRWEAAVEFGPEVHGRGPRQEILDFSENNLALSVSKQLLPGLGLVGWWVDFFFFPRYPPVPVRPPDPPPSGFTSDVPLVRHLVDSLCFVFFVDSINQSKRCGRGEEQEDGTSTWCEKQAAASEISRRRLHRPGRRFFTFKENRTLMLFFFFF